MAVVSVSLFIICILCSAPVMEKSWWKLLCLFLYLLFVFFVPVPLWRSRGGNCGVCHVKLFIKSVFDHYSVDFLGKGKVFQFDSLFRVSALLHITSLDF